jgi:outer membrane protein TolC
MFFLFAGGLNYSLQAQSANYPQLEEYLQIAIDQNPELQSLRYLVEAEREKAREMSALPDPELNINYDFNPMMSEFQLGRFSFSAMQMFPWFGTLNALRDAQTYSAEARQASLDGRQLKLLRDIQIIWFSIAEVKQQIQIAEQTLNLVSDLEQLVEIRYETARTGQADILRIQMEKQRIRNRIENLQDKLLPLTSSFNAFLNRNPDEEVNTAEPRRKPELQLTQDEITSLAISENPEFETLSFSKSALEQQARTAELMGRPSFGIGLEIMGRDFGPMSMNPDATESFIGMATIRLPIYRTRIRSQKQQITNRIQSVDMERVQTENRLTSDLEEATENFRSSLRTITLLDQELIPRARQVLDILTEEYTAGNARFDELLQIQRELLDLEFERIEAVVDQNKAMARIEELIGGQSPFEGGTSEARGG